MTFLEYMKEFQPTTRIRHDTEIFFTIFKRASQTSLNELGFSARYFYKKYMNHLLKNRIRKVS